MTVEAWISRITLTGLIVSALAVLAVSYCIYIWFRHEPWRARDLLREQKEKEKQEKEHPTVMRMTVEVTIPKDTAQQIAQLLPEISMPEAWRSAAKTMNAGE